MTKDYTDNSPRSAATAAVIPQQHTLKQPTPTPPTSLSEKYRIYRPSELKARVKQLGRSGFIVDGLIPRQSLALMIGDSGLGKSPLLYQAAACVASGTPFLGHDVRKGRVLYIDCENGLGQVGAIVTQVSKHLGLAKPPDDLFLWNLNDCLAEFGKKMLADMVKAVQPSLVVCDPLGGIFGDAERDNPAAIAAYASLRGIMSDCGCSVVVVHHLRKADRDSIPSLDTFIDAREWFQEARGPRVLINGSDIRLGVDRPSASLSNTESKLVLRGFGRVRGEIPLTRIGTVYDEDGEPCSFQQLTGAQLLGNSEQQDAFKRLPDEFRFKDAQAAYGKGPQATTDFLNKCISAGILRKVVKGRYEKLQPPGESLPIAA